MNRAFDVIAIGGGIAGVAAAVAAAERGARCAIVRAAPGASALGGGGWLDAPPDSLAARLAAHDFPLVPCTVPLPHPDGDLVPCAYVPPSHARALPGSGTLVVGIAGLPGFRAAALASLWGEACGATLDSLTLELPGTPPAGWSPASLAAALDREPGLLAAALTRHDVAKRAERAIVPAVLGLADPLRVQEEVQTGAGLTIGEALGATPSLPGLRLQRVLDALLRAAEVRVIVGRVIGFTAVNRSVRSLDVDSAGGPHSLEATAVILATGRFLGGGIDARPAWRESVFDFPVRIRHVDTEFRTMEPLVLSDPDRNAPQLWASAGVRVDDENVPLGGDGLPAYVNVFAAGAVVAGPLPGLGAAARQGHAAGVSAASFAAAGAVS